MKRCPQCRRDYYDDSLSYCLDDGAALLEGPPSFDLETANLAGLDSATDAETLPQGFPVSTGQKKKLEGLRGNLSSASRPSRYSRLFIVVLGSVAALSIAGAVIFYGLSWKSAQEHFRNIKLQRITAEGNVDSVTISPDGKYVAYVAVEDTNFSLWTRHLPTNSRVKIASPAGVKDLYAAGFSQDGNYVYYSATSQDNGIYDVFQIPVLGGSPRKIMSGVTAGIYFSPDGRRISYTRFDNNTNEMSVMIADADGTNERLLAIRKWPYRIGILGPTWSPNGNALAVEVQPPGPNNDTVAKIDVNEGTVTPLCEKTFAELHSVRWLHDGRALVFAAREGPSSSYQIWYLPYPDGEPRRLTMDFDSYGWASLSIPSDDSALAVIQSRQFSAMYVANAENANTPILLSATWASNDGSAGVSWDNGGRLFYASVSEGRSQVWMRPSVDEPATMISDGEERRGVTVTRDGRYFLFQAWRPASRDLWRSDLDGGNPKQVISMNDSRGEFSVSPDSKWVIFSYLDGGIGKVSVDGSLLSRYENSPACFNPQFSPDGKLISCVQWDAEGNLHFSVFKIEGNTLVPQKVIESSINSTDYRWSPDGRSLIYVRTSGTFSNLWKYPIDGGKPTQLTNFKSEKIVDFAFSPDGKEVAMARGPISNDAVLITDAH